MVVQLFFTVGFIPERLLIMSAIIITGMYYNNYNFYNYCYYNHHYRTSNNKNELYLNCIIMLIPPIPSSPPFPPSTRLPHYALARHTLHPAFSHLRLPPFLGGILDLGLLSCAQHTPKTDAAHLAPLRRKSGRMSKGRCTCIRVPGG